MLKLHYMVTLVSSHLMPKQLTRLLFFFFPEEVKWVRCQANKAGITIFIQISNVINPMLQLVCQRSGAHKVQEKTEA